MDASCQTLLEQLRADVTEDNRHGEWDTEAAVGGGEWESVASGSDLEYTSASLVA